MKSPHTKQYLREQSDDIRKGMILQDILDQLSKQFGIDRVNEDSDMPVIFKHVKDLIDNTPRSRLPEKQKPLPSPQEAITAVLSKSFPFISAAKFLSLVDISNTVGELRAHINCEVCT